MLAKRIIPCLDVNCGRVVKGVNFVNLKQTFLQRKTIQSGKLNLTICLASSQ